MLEALGAALDRAVELNAEAISLNEAQPPSDRQAVLASALRENRDALVRSAQVLAAAWEEVFAAGRAFERSQVPVPRAPSGLRLVKLAASG